MRYSRAAYYAATAVWRSAPFKGPGLRIAAMEANKITESNIDLYTTLARDAHDRRNLQDAFELYDKILEFRRKTEEQLSPRVAASLHNIGRVFVDLKNYYAAIEALQEASAVYEQTVGVRDPRFLESLALLAHSHSNIGDKAKARIYFTEALAGFRAKYYDEERQSWVPRMATTAKDIARFGVSSPSDSPLYSVAHCLADFGMLLESICDYRRAHDLFRQSYLIQEFLFAEDNDKSSLIAQTANLLAANCFVLGLLDDALAYADKAIAACKKSMGRVNPGLAVAYTTKGNVFLRKGCNKRALYWYNEATVMYAVSFTKESPLVAGSLLNVARAEERVGNFDAAKERIRNAIVISTRTLGDSASSSSGVPLVADAHLLLAMMHRDRGSRLDAIAAAKESIDVRDTPVAREFIADQLAADTSDLSTDRTNNEIEAHLLAATDMVDRTPHMSYFLSQRVRLGFKLAAFFEKTENWDRTMVAVRSTYAALETVNRPTRLKPVVCLYGAYVAICAGNIDEGRRWLSLSGLTGTQ